MNLQENVSAFFVYGTLKFGQLRGGLWPCKPQSIEPAVVLAKLFDLGSYPAITPGTDWVFGELWKFRLEDMARTIIVLDQIEGYQELAKGNEYDRRVVDAEHQNSTGFRSQKAFAYFVADLKVLSFAKPIPPFLTAFDRWVAAWPAPSSKVPKSFSEE